MRRPSSSTFSNDFSSEAAIPNLIASTGGGNENLCFLFRSDKNSGCSGNLNFPLTCIVYGDLYFVVRLGIFEFCFYINLY